MRHQAHGSRRLRVHDEVLVTSLKDALINSSPLETSITDSVERKRLLTIVIYPVCSALVGIELSDRLSFGMNRSSLPPARSLARNGPAGGDGMICGV